MKTFLTIIQNYTKRLWKISNDWIYIPYLINYSNPLRTYNKIKKYFKPFKGFFVFRKHCMIPLMFWNYNTFIYASDVCWKDKFDSPRFEESPCFLINMFGYTFGYIWKFNEENDYWEQALWYLYYTKPLDIKEAKETWPWENYETKESTWSDEFLKM